MSPAAVPCDVPAAISTVTPAGRIVEEDLQRICRSFLPTSRRVHSGGAGHLSTAGSKQWYDRQLQFPPRRHRSRPAQPFGTSTNLYNFSANVRDLFYFDQQSISASNVYWRNVVGWPASLKPAGADFLLRPVLPPKDDGLRLRYPPAVVGCVVVHRLRADSSGSSPFCDHHSRSLPARCNSR